MPYTLTPLTPAIGAQVTGLAPDAVSDADARALADALHTHKILVFRGLDGLTPRGQLALATRFGTPQRFPYGHPPEPDLPEVMVLATNGDGPKVSNADIWHSDATFMATPPLGTMLRAVQLPELGGDTLWADMETAYAALSPAMQGLLDGLTAEHDPAKSANHRRTADGGGTPDPVRHPVVRTHPVTGRRSLYVNRVFTTRIVELTDAENELLLPFLFGHVARPEFQVRHAWRKGDVALWDNRSTQHYAVYDYRGARVMHRIVLEGDTPV